jgi:Flp pilus assembly protein TadG
MTTKKTPVTHGTLIKFANDRSGAVAIIFAFTVFILLGIVGGAVDYGRWLTAKSKQQAAIDAAVLAAGRVFQISNGDTYQSIAAADEYYSKMKSTLLSNDTTNFAVVDNGGAMLATSSAVVITPFLQFAGVSSLPVNITSKAVMTAAGNADKSIEISLMLDVTGSMGGSKISDLKLAAKDLIDIVVWDDQSEHYSRVAIAPFSEHVNIGTQYFQKVTGQTPSGSGTDRTCVRERQTFDRYTDAAPGPGNYFDRYPGSGTCRPQSLILPLSSNKSTLKSHLDGLGAQGRTAGHLGTAWAWYMLSPKWNNVFSSSPAPASYSNSDVQKIAVLMTDGEYNQYYSGASSATQAREVCSNMKAAGLTVYTVGFQLNTGGEAYQTMQQCATSSSHFFNSTTGDELRQAFREIALQVVTLRLSN